MDSAETHGNTDVPDRSEAPGWVRDYLEGMDYEAERHASAELETELPGLHQAFERLISLLPDPNSIYVASGEFPVVAAVVRIGSNGNLELVSTSTNRVNEKGDSIAHAEIEALKEAQKISGTKHLKDHFLLTTLEPCIMCSGAIINTEVSGLIYGAKHDDVASEHALVNGQYKPYRTSPKGFDADTYLASFPNTRVINNFMKSKVLQKMRRTPVTLDEHYRDPDARNNGFSAAA